MINRYTASNPNSGHGHIYLRPDGATCRCGGPFICEHCRADALAHELERTGPLPEKHQSKRKVNLVYGPKGFTESFDNHTVELLVRLGILEHAGIASSESWHTTMYKNTTEAPMDIDV